MSDLFIIKKKRKTDSIFSYSYLGPTSSGVVTLETGRREVSGFRCQGKNLSAKYLTLRITMEQFLYTQLSTGGCYSVFSKILAVVLSRILLHGIVQNFACNILILQHDTDIVINKDIIIVIVFQKKIVEYKSFEGINNFTPLKVQ